MLKNDTMYVQFVDKILLYWPFWEVK